MVYVTPDYYNEFQCIASRCKHSCCIGWEIDIDEETYEQYSGMEGPLGHELKKHISTEETPHFVLGKDERCPFLNEENLCRLILEAGEECLCEICAEHPRFYHFLPGRTEVGLGLCCEEAGRLLLSWDCGVSLLEYDDGVDDGDEENRERLELREELFALAQERSFTVKERMERMLAFVGAMPLEELLTAFHRWVSMYQSLERLDDVWTVQLAKLAAYEGAFATLEDENLMNGYENLLVYFLYRHVMTEEGRDPALTVAFCVLSVVFLAVLDDVYRRDHGVLTLEQRVEYARLYSSEIEYSDENVAAVLAHIEEKMCST